MNENERLKVRVTDLRPGDITEHGIVNRILSFGSETLVLFHDDSNLRDKTVLFQSNDWIKIIRLHLSARDAFEIHKVWPC